jgi:ribosomal protein L24, bacterial/organelle
MATKKNTVKRFAPKLHIRKGDQVVVTAGDDKGKQGAVLQVFPEKNRAIVEGIRMMKKHIKATQTEAGGIQETEASIHISNLAHIDPKSGEATRIGRREENGVRVRYSKKSGNVIK